MTGKSISIVLSIAALALVAGCGSDAKSPTSLDTSPPAVPTGLTLTTSQGVATLTWNPNVGDADFAGFRLVRVSGQERTALVGTPEVLTSFVDPLPSRGVRYSYELTAVDEVGNESGRAVVSVTLSVNREGPTPSGGGDGDEPWQPGETPAPRVPGGDLSEH